MRPYLRGYALIHLDRLRENMSALKGNVGAGTKVYAVVKADGYGHGISQVAKALKDQVYGFATATIWEALKLKAEGIENPLLVLGLPYDGTYEDYITNDIRCTVASYEDGRKLSEAAVRLSSRAAVHIKIDTGMSRLGFLWSDESREEIQRISRLPGIVIEGIFSHFASSDEADKTSAKIQLAEFNAIVKDLCRAGLEIPVRHIANSGAIIDMPEASMDAVRPGIATYGLYPSEDVDKEAVRLRPVLEWKSRLSSIKTIPKGRGVSYGSTYITDSEKRIGVIPVGYGDGYPRALSGKGCVLVRGRKAPILGRVCMDQFMVDVTDIEGVSLGDEVTLVGEDKGGTITVHDICELTGGFHYEFLCNIGKRVPREYRDKD